MNHYTDGDKSKMTWVAYFEGKKLIPIPDERYDLVKEFRKAGLTVKKERIK